MVFEGDVFGHLKVVFVRLRGPQTLTRTMLALVSAIASLLAS